LNIHDRVNYAVSNANLELDEKERKIILNFNNRYKNMSSIRLFRNIYGKNNDE